MVERFILVGDTHFNSNKNLNCQRYVTRKSLNELKTIIRNKVKVEMMSKWKKRRNYHTIFELNMQENEVLFW